MKYFMDLYKSVSHHVEYLEEAMADYVGYHDRVRF